MHSVDLRVFALQLVGPSEQVKFGWLHGSVAGSIPDGVTIILHWHNPSGRTVFLGLTQLLTEMSTSNISWGLRQPVHRAENLTTFICRLS